MPYSLARVHPLQTTDGRTDGRTTTIPTARPLRKYGRLKTKTKTSYSWIFMSVLLLRYHTLYLM